MLARRKRTNKTSTFTLPDLHEDQVAADTVGMLVGQIGAGRTIEQLLADYPYLEREDILQALRYAAWRSEEREIAFA